MISELPLESLRIKRSKQGKEICDIGSSGEPRDRVDMLPQIPSTADFNREKRREHKVGHGGKRGFSDVHRAAASADVCDQLPQPLLPEMLAGLESLGREEVLL